MPAFANRLSGASHYSVRICYDALPPPNPPPRKKNPPPPHPRPHPPHARPLVLRVLDEARADGW